MYEVYIANHHVESRHRPNCDRGRRDWSPAGHVDLDRGPPKYVLERVDDLERLLHMFHRKYRGKPFTSAENFLSTYTQSKH